MNATAPQEPQSWSNRHWWSVIALAVAAHFALVCIFGAKNGRPVRPVERVPFLQLARPGDEWMGLQDPTLFALPHPHDFAAATVAEWPLIAPAPPSLDDPAALAGAFQHECGAIPRPIS